MPVRTTPATHRLCAALLAALAVPALPAMAQEAGSKDAKPTVKTLDQVTVTGSRIKRADVETSQPIFTLSRAEIQKQGVTSVADVLQRISTNGAALNTTFNNGGDGSAGISLRNLGEGRTLVLVPRETPLSLVHLRNLVAVTEAGAVVVPAAMAAASASARPDCRPSMSLAVDDGIAYECKRIHSQ